MIVGLLRVELLIHNSRSLKAKRHVLKGLKERLRRGFNISVAEIDNHDKWQRATLGIAYLDRNKALVNSALDKILNFIETFHEVQLTDQEMEIL
ncbi:MAG: DUF503 domain-containing protein [Candidatus Omnitrophica bacterium]|nr:DUF503 domain-containing protein [Candidatus Omnitrophota bacterium]